MEESTRIDKRWISLIVLAIYLTEGVSGFDPCMGYQVMNDTDRGYDNTDRVNLKCDARDLKPGVWYRFTGDAGNVISNTCHNEDYRCGSKYTAYIPDPLPEGFNVTSVRGCIHKDNDCCADSLTVLVKRCQTDEDEAFVVYELMNAPADKCFFRFCSESQNITLTTSPTTQAPAAATEEDPVTTVTTRRAADAGRGLVPTSPTTATSTSGTTAVTEADLTPVVYTEGPCSNYKTLNNPDRNINNGQSSPAKCDDRNTIKKKHWYRFTGRGGNVVTETCQQSNRCQTIETAYFKGSHPTDFDPKNVTACTRLHGNCCWRSTNATIQRCQTVADGTFFVYKLAWPLSAGCSFRYCTEEREFPRLAAGNVPITPPPVPLEEISWPCYNYEAVDEPDRNVNHNESSPAKCDRTEFQEAVWYRFRGLGGNMIARTCPSKRRCQTHATAFINGTLPDDFHPKAMNACVHWSFSCCYKSAPIVVKRCQTQRDGAFFIYQLSTPGSFCSFRYCTEQVDIPLLTHLPVSPAAPPAEGETQAPPLGGVVGVNWEDSGPCGDYVTLNDSTRSVNTDTHNLEPLCDNGMTGDRWYRFIGNGGNVIPEKCVPEERCQTHMSTWINGTHPKDFMEKNVTACANWENSCCDKTQNITIKRCQTAEDGAFFVYRLMKFGSWCYFRYCTEERAVPVLSLVPTVPPTTTPPVSVALEVTPEGCEDYEAVEQPDRSVNNTDQDSDIECDGRFIKHDKWYRFVGEGGNVIPEICPSNKRCQTHASTWLNGTHPTDFNPKRVTACSHWSGNCCYKSMFATIQRCQTFEDGPFFVYQLENIPRGWCSFRYCTDHKVVEPLSEIPSTPAPPNGENGPCADYTTLDNPNRSVNNSLSGTKCDHRDLSSDTWYRFIGAGGNAIPEKCPSKNTCQTHAAAWINGKHPTDFNITEVKGCGHWDDECCHKEVNVLIRRCQTAADGPFFVYRLNWPGSWCNYRYCTEHREMVALVDGVYPTTTPLPLGPLEPVIHNTGPCADYVTVNQSNRAVSNTNQDPRVYCDKSFIKRDSWYRFIGDGGNVIPEECPPTKRCQTHASAFINDTHPTDFNIKTVRACAHWSDNCCHKTMTAKIKRCQTPADGAFFVYQLERKSWCSHRYCTVEKHVSVITAGGATLTTASPPVTLPENVWEVMDGPCMDYATLDQPNRNVNYTNRTDIFCDKNDLNEKLWYRFVGSGGNTIPEFCPTPWYCGTHAASYLTEPHPTDFLIHTMKYCGSWEDSCCHSNDRTNIQVKRCQDRETGSFYIYKMKKQTWCSYRMCTVQKQIDLAIEPTTIPANADHVENAWPCNEYITVDDPNRNINYTGGNAQCDYKFFRDKGAEKWYRFVGSGGNQLPEKCPPTNRCQTHATAYLVGEHPENFEIASRQACAHWSDDCCHKTMDIRVKRCQTPEDGGYFLYELKVPVDWCSLRYCTVQKPVPYIGPTVNLTTPSPPDLIPMEDNSGPCQEYITLDQPGRSVNNSNDLDGLKCDDKDLDRSKWYRFIGAGGNVIPEKCPAKEHCQTHATAWINDTHPTDFAIKTVNTCANWISNCCYKQSTAKIKRCQTQEDGAFFVYQLDMPGSWCQLRYCTDHKDLALVLEEPPPPPEPEIFIDDTGVCANYTLLRDEDRSINNEDQSPTKCDDRDISKSVWYRFSGEGGNMLPEECPSKKRCQTHATAYLNGKHPEGFEITTMPACAHWSSRCCYKEMNIQVKRCQSEEDGAYFVYRLDWPSGWCSLRYCTVQQDMPLVTQIPTAPPTTTSVDIYVHDTPACQNYVTIDNPDRSVTNGNLDPIRCDRNDVTRGAWYRFVGEGGNAIPETCPEIRHCQTHAPAYINGTHPSDFEEKTVTGCLHWLNKCCYKTLTVRIQRCQTQEDGGFFVYSLDFPGDWCNFRYCTVNKPVAMLHPDNLTPTPPPPPAISFEHNEGPCSNYTILDESDRSINNTGQNPLKCDKNKFVTGQWYRFIGQGGNVIPESCPPVERCQTHASAWINGTHPTGFEIKTVPTCAAWSSKCCNQKSTMKIARCQTHEDRAFFVYQPNKAFGSWCQARYCTKNVTVEPVFGPRPTLPSTAPPTTIEVPVEEADGPCTDHVTVDDEKRSINNNDQGGVMTCDKQFLEGEDDTWYRFVGEGGNTIPENCPEKNRCGTHATGFINGTHPLHFNITTMKACAHWSSRCCYRTSTIKVKRCQTRRDGAFYVYNLRAFGSFCQSRFCTVQKDIPLIGFPTTPPPPPFQCPEVNYTCPDCNIVCPPNNISCPDIHCPDCPDCNCPECPNMCPNPGLGHSCPACPVCHQQVCPACNCPLCPGFNPDDCPDCHCPAAASCPDKPCDCEKCPACDCMSKEDFLTYLNSAGGDGKEAKVLEQLGGPAVSLSGGKVVTYTVLWIAVILAFVLGVIIGAVAVKLWIDKTICASICRRPPPSRAMYGKNDPPYDELLTMSSSEH